MGLGEGGTQVLACRELSGYLIKKKKEWKKMPEVNSFFAARRLCICRRVKLLSAAIAWERCTQPDECFPRFVLKTYSAFETGTGGGGLDWFRGLIRAHLATLHMGYSCYSLISCLALDGTLKPRHKLSQWVVNGSTQRQWGRWVSNG